MTQPSTNVYPPLAPWHRKLLAAAAICIILLIAMGGVLCATHSIRTCPDWPGCFGKIVPPLQTSPILEYTHRVLAALSGLLILASLVAGLARARRVRWIALPPLVAIPLLIAVSFFGATVVLHGLAAGWAAVDVGSALGVAALIVTTAAIARARRLRPDLPDRLAFNGQLGRLALATLILVYGIFVSGVLVTGADSLTGCLGWPIYSLSQFRTDGHPVGDALRLAASLLALGMIGALLARVRVMGKRMPVAFRAAAWIGALLVLELLLQPVLQIYHYNVYLRVAYSVIAAPLWGLLALLVTEIGIEGSLSAD